MSPTNNRTRPTHRPERSSVVVSGPDDIRDALEEKYGTRLRLQQTRRDETDPPLTHERVDVGSFAIDDVCLPGEMEFSPDSSGEVVALWASSGRLEGHCDGIKGEASAGELAMVSQADLPYFARVDDLTVTALLIDPSIVAGLAAGVPVHQAPPTVRFDDFRPVSPAACNLWKSTLTYVKSSVLADDALATPLVIGHASRLLAAVTLAAFPSSAGAHESACDTDGKPVLLRRAVDYMDDNVASDIGLSDVAHAIHVTPRAVQYMFRKHLDTTPLQYLRQLRLDRAHRDLLEADCQNDTVTAVAARWGFTHSGRFALQYRRVYGQSPHATLRG